MAKNSVSAWDPLASNNSDIAGINIAENCPPQGINDAIRAIMAQIAALYTTLIQGGASVLNDFLGAINKRMGNASTIYDTLASPAERMIGYRTLPLGATQTAAYTIGLGDVAFAVPITTGGITIPANATTAFAVGDIVLILNSGSGSQSITPASGVTLTLAATASTGARTLAQNGVATLWKVGTDSWMIYGVGVG